MQRGLAVLEVEPQGDKVVSPAPQSFPTPRTVQDLPLPRLGVSGDSADTSGEQRRQHRVEPLAAGGGGGEAVVVEA